MTLRARDTFEAFTEYVQANPGFASLTPLGWFEAGYKASAGLHAEMLTALEFIESVYRLNCVTPDEPSSVLDELQRVIAKAQS